MTRRQRRRLEELMLRASLTYEENQELIEILESTSALTASENERLEKAKRLKEEWDEKDPELFKPLETKEVVINGKEYLEIPRQVFCKKCTCIYGSFNCHQKKCLIKTKPGGN